MNEFAKLKAEMPSRVKMDVSPRALSLWNPDIKMAGDSDDNVITIYDVIGSDFYSEGVTVKRISAALRSIGHENDVVVNINSPGGDWDHGIAINSLLKAHKGKVTVNVIALAASAASVIAMAGDDIRIAEAGFVMIHDAWVLAIGNKQELRGTADWLEPFDSSTASLYAKRTGQEKAEIQKMMTAETWLESEKAIELGFVDGLMDAETVESHTDGTTDARSAHKKVDIAMAIMGINRTVRQDLLNALKPVTPGADGDEDMPSAVDVGELVSLTKELRGLSNERN